MKLKKLAAIGLSIVLAIGCFAGCGKSEKEAQESGDTVSGEIRYAFWDAGQQAYLEECAKRFNETYPDVEVILEPSSWNEYWTKLEAGATGGSIADVFWMNGPNIMKYAEGGILMGIDELVAEANLDMTKYPEALVDLYNVNGVQYAIPKDFDTIGVWYNKAIFDEAGVPYPSDDWTWEDMADAAKQLTKSDGSVYGIGAYYDNQSIIYNTIPAAGGYVISDDKTKSGYDLEETQQGVQCWVDLHKAGVTPTQAQLEETEANVQFLSGRLAMYWCGSWFVNQVLESDIKDSVDVAALPSINGNRATVIHGLGNCIAGNTKNPVAAWKWVEFLSGEEANILSAEMGAAIPAYEGTSDVWANKHSEMNLTSFITSAEEYSFEYPASKNSAEWEQHQADNLKRAFSLEVDVKEACENLAAQMNEVLAEEAN